MTLRLSLSGLMMLVSQQRCTTAPAWSRYTIGLAALGLAEFCVHQAIVPVRQVDITIRGLKTTANSHGSSHMAGRNWTGSRVGEILAGALYVPA